MELYLTIKHLYPDLKDDEFVLYDDGTGAKIIKWESTQPQPTEDELNTAWNNVALKNAQEEKIAELDNACNAAILGNFPYTVNGVTYYFPNDTTAQSNFDKFYIAFKDGIATSPTNFTCYDALTGGKACRVSFNEATFPGLYKAHLEHIALNIAKFRDVLEQKVLACTSPDDVSKITWDSISISQMLAMQQQAQTTTSTSRSSATATPTVTKKVSASSTRRSRSTAAATPSVTTKVNATKTSKSAATTTPTITTKVNAASKSRSKSKASPNLA